VSKLFPARLEHEIPWKAFNITLTLNISHKPAVQVPAPLKKVTEDYMIFSSDGTYLIL
jgi:hypothetical protein